MNTFNFLLKKQYQSNSGAMLRSVFTVQAIQLTIKKKHLERVRIWIDKNNLCILFDLSQWELHTFTLIH